jgi:glucosamine--fructose-6-phosphate aminotransferase (isomerizing)
MTTPYIEQEIQEQPAVLSRVLRAARPAIEGFIEPGKPKRLHFVGCGDMFFAAEVVSWLARLHWNMDAWSWRSMDLRWTSTALGPEDLVVCASVSGRTPRVIEAARAARRAGARVLGITDNEGSPFAREVDRTVVLQTSPRSALSAGPYPGYHHPVGQTKTYTAVLFAELMAAARAAGDDALDLEAIPARVAAHLPGLSRHIATGALEWLAGRENVLVLGSGPHLGTALYGAAKFLEYAVPAHAQCLEEVNHLEIFIANERTLAVVLAPDDASAGRAEELLEPWEKLGVRSLLVGPAGDHGGRRTAQVPVEREAPHVAPFVQAVALQLIAHRGAVALGRDPDAWLGGVRTDLLIETSRRTVRGSRIGP